MIGRFRFLIVCFKLGITAYLSSILNRWLKLVNCQFGCFSHTVVVVIKSYIYFRLCALREVYLLNVYKKMFCNIFSLTSSSFTLLSKEEKNKFYLRHWNCLYFQIVRMNWLYLASNESGEVVSKTNFLFIVRKLKKSFRKLPRAVLWKSYFELFLQKYHEKKLW